MFSAKRQFALSLVAINLACGLAINAANPPGAKAPKGESVPPPPPVQTATIHPMCYYVSLPKQWSKDRQWPVLVAPSAHYPNRDKTIALFAAERDRRKADFIIVCPFVINSDSVASIKEYRGAVADAISAADAADGFRDSSARAKFDSEGIQAVLKDVQQLYRGEAKVYITGFSASTHVAFLMLFTHPELLKGAFINSGNYLGRGVDENHIPLRNSPERAAIAVQFTLGESQSSLQELLDCWTETKGKLISYGHRESKMQMEIIHKNNPEKLSSGHNWYPTRILDFCETVEREGKP